MASGDGDLAASLRALKLCSSSARKRTPARDGAGRAREELREMMNVRGGVPTPQARAPAAAGARAAAAERQESCRHCGRTFRVDSLARHEAVCQKVFGKRSRPIFDSGMQRRVTDGSFDAMRAGPAAARRGGGRTKRPSGPSSGARRCVDEIPVGGRAKVGKQADWRKKSSQLRSALAAMRGGGSTGSYSSYSMEGVPDARAGADDDRQQCPFCGRKFSATAFPRHRAFCEEQARRKRITARATGRSTKR